MTIPSPDNNFIKKVNLSLFAFLWDNIPDKIKWVYVTQDYTNGGLRMVYIEGFIQSLKLTWMNRLFKSDSQPWLQLFWKINFTNFKISTLWFYLVWHINKQNTNWILEGNFDMEKNFR